MLIDFKLRPLDRVTPWGGPEAPRLHWFALTEGEYWIEAGGRTLFEYAPESGASSRAGKFCEYYVARLHEDLLTIAPHVLTAAPPDLHPYLFALSPAYGRHHQDLEFVARLEELRKAEGPDDERQWDLVDLATSWIGRRELDTAYLTDGPACILWSDDAHVHIVWSAAHCADSGVPVWSARSGAFSLSRSAFIRALSGFHDRLMAEMGARVEAVLAGALAREIAVDRDALRRENAARAAWIEPALSTPNPPTEWTAIRAAIREFESAPVSRR
jgi:hypothetical protein